MMIEQLINQYKPQENEPAFVRQARDNALQALKKLGLPTTKNENWKYTTLTPLIKNTFVLSNIQQDTIDFELLKSLLDQVDLSNCYPVVFYNGKFIAEFSEIIKLPVGVSIRPLDQFLQNATEQQLRTVFTDDVSYSNDSFVALNHSLAQTGVVIRIDSGIKLGKPIKLVFIGEGEEKLAVNYKNIIQLDAESEAIIIEEYIADDNNQQFTNVVNQITVSNNAQYNHYRNQRLNIAHFHINRTIINQYAKSNCQLFGLDCGGRLVRNDIMVNLLAEKALCDLRGLYLQNQRSHVDNHIFVNHQAPDCTSNQAYKGIIADRARAVFNGKVFVKSGAIKTDAQQKNDNLLLSSDAEIDTKPELEIYADDVQCAHGCTVGQIDQQQLFYLQSRGINKVMAKKIIIQAFCHSLLGFMEKPIKHSIENIVDIKLKSMS